MLQYNADCFPFLERPMREYEIVMEIYNSWNLETRVNYFMLKQTNQVSLLAASVCLTPLPPLFFFGRKTC
jgi:hypothetical protein